jgi:RIO-like serine/threonine protein kinase
MRACAHVSIAPISIDSYIQGALSVITPDTMNIDTASEAPFQFSRPKLLSHKPRSQVFLCDYSSTGSDSVSACIIKVFTARDKVSYRKESSVYSLARGSGLASGLNALPTKLGSGEWDATRYQEFIGGKFPSAMRRSEVGVDVIVLAYIESFNAFGMSESLETRIRGAKSALRTLQTLHTNGIVHGDISVNNVLIQRYRDSYTATWIDFSASVINPTRARIALEWRNAIDYFSQLVPSSCL